MFYEKNVYMYEKRSNSKKELIP